eukprot:6146861-Pleurochrysis_carterae.AAC.1
MVNSATPRSRRTAGLSRRVSDQEEGAPTEFHQRCAGARASRAKRVRSRRHSPTLPVTKVMGDNING